MTVGRDPLTVSVGAGSLFIAPIGTAEPVSLSLSFPSAWVNIGYTEKGTTFTRGTTSADVDVAEEFYGISRVFTAYTGTVDFAFSQLTAANLSYCFNGGTITVNTGDVTFDPPAAGTETPVMIGWDSNARDERYIWRKCYQVGATATSRQKVLPQALLPVSFALVKPASLQPFRWWGTAGSATPVRTGQ
jgi:hypothetical protein